MKLRNLLLLPLMLLAGIAISQDLTLDMVDSFGDGWDTTVDVCVGANTYTVGGGFTGGFTFSETLPAAVGDLVSIKAGPCGPFPGEVESLIITDFAGVIVAQFGPGDFAAACGTGAVIGTQDSPVTAIAPPPPPGCDYSFQLSDSFGDGWNGATVDVVDITNGTSQSFGLLGGAAACEIVSVADGSDIDIVFNGGGTWDCEISLVMVDPFGVATTLINENDFACFAANTATLISFTNACPAAVPMANCADAVGGTVDGCGDPIDAPCFDLTDPCACLNPLNLYEVAGDNTSPLTHFAEQIDITATDPALLTFVSITGAFDANGAPLTTLPSTVGPHNFWHLPVVGYSAIFNYDGVDYEITNACVDDCCVIECADSEIIQLIPGECDVYNYLFDIAPTCDPIDVAIAPPVAASVYDGGCAGSVGVFDGALGCSAGPNTIILDMPDPVAGEVFSETCFASSTFYDGSAFTIDIYDATICTTLPDITGCTPIITYAVAAGGPASAVTCYPIPTTPGAPIAGCAAGTSPSTGAPAPFAGTEDLWLAVVATGSNATIPIGTPDGGCGGTQTWIIAPACGLDPAGDFASVGFTLDAAATFNTVTEEVLDVISPSCPNPAAVAPTNLFASGDDLPIGTWDFDYVVFDDAGNSAACQWSVTVNGFDQPTATLACNDAVNISIDANCDFTVSADAFLEGGPYGCYTLYDVYIRPNGGPQYAVGVNPLVLADTPVNLNGATLANVPLGTHIYEVFDPATGNTCWGEFTLEDKIAPVIPTDLGTVDHLCFEDDTPAAPISFGGCDCAFGTTSYTDTVIDGGDCGTTVVSRAWTCEDAAGNVSNVGIQIVNFTPIDLGDFNLAPIATPLTLPPGVVTLPCGTGTSPQDIMDYFDNKVWLGASILDYGDYTTWAPLANPTNDASCSTEFIENEEGVQVGYPAWLAWGFNSNCTVKQPHYQAVDNNICSVFVTYSDQNLAACGDDCAGNMKVIRTWTVIDWCDPNPLTGGGAFDYVQVIKNVDDVAPEVSAPNISLSVNPWGCAASGPLPAPEHLFDACSSNLTYSVSGTAGTVFQMPDGSWAVTGLAKGVHTYTYTAVDCCGNVASSTMTVTVVDDTPPVAIATQNLVVSLTSGGFDTGGTAKIFTYHIDGGSHDGDCGPVALEIRRPDGANACGNIGIDGHNNNETFNNTSNNNDDDLDDTDGGAYVKFCCADLDGVAANSSGVVSKDSMVVIMRVWDDGNCDGFANTAPIDYNGDGDVLDPGEFDNYNETWAYVKLENKLPPVIVCPPDATISCDTDWLLHSGASAPTAAEMAVLAGPEGTGVATGAGVCGAVNITYSDNYSEDICYGDDDEIKRTWCIEGTSTCCTQIIDIVDSAPFNPATIDWPNALVELSCMDGDLDEPSWVDSPCGLIGWSVQSDTFFLEGDACIKVLHSYRIIDWCVNNADPSMGIYTFVQTVKVLDPDAPTIEGDLDCVAVTNNDCNEMVTLCYTANDDGDCTSPWLKWQVAVDLNSNWTYDYSYSSYLPTNNPFYIAPTEPGQAMCITLPAAVSSSKYDHRAVITVSDGCTNVTSITDEFLVVDKKAPTPYCHSVSSALMAGDNPSVELWACDFVIDGIDNCTSADQMRYTFTSTPPEDDADYNPETKCSAKTYTCADIGDATSGVVMVDVYFWDECGNFDFCSVELTLNGPCSSGPDGAGRIAGDVGTEYGDMVEDVIVSITSNQPEYPMTLNTNSNGQYDSNNHDYNYNYTLNAYKNDDPRNGVSTLDIVLIQRHILNLQSLSSAYQYIAADANADQNITAADLVDIRKLILEVTDVYPNNDSWRFVDANQALTTANAFAFNETLDILSLSTDMTNENWVAVKVGDVNGNAVVNANGSDAELRSGKNLALTLAGTTTSEGVSVAVTSSNFADIAGYQFTMNTNGLELMNVESGAIEVADENIAVIDGSTLTMSWNTLNATSVGSEVLFTLHFAGSDLTAVDGMTISSEVTNAEAYDADLNIMNVVLGDVADAEYALFQNEPNPFATQTTIEFSLATAGTATLNVLDVTGKVVKQITNTYAKGMNSIVLRDLGVSGVLYYTLESGDFSATKKMIIIE